MVASLVEPPGLGLEHRLSLRSRRTSKYSRLARYPRLAAFIWGYMYMHVIRLDSLPSQNKMRLNDSPRFHDAT